MTTTRPQLPVMSFLTKREVDVACRLHLRMSYTQIAIEMGITADTARKMTKDIAAKLVQKNGPQARHPAGPRETVLRWLDMLNTRS